MNSKLFNPIKTKIVATIALLFFVLLGAGTIMSMKAPDKGKTPAENKRIGAVTKNLINYYWFNVNASGNPTTLITDVSGVCPDASGTLCAKQYAEGDTQGSGTSRTVISTEYADWTSRAWKDE
jgi:hypothetical protein